MVQGIDYTSVSPIFSNLLQFGFVSVVYSIQAFQIAAVHYPCSDISGECS